MIVLRASLIALWSASSAGAYSVSTDCKALSSEDLWCLRNGAHNWTLGQTQLWGLNEHGTGGGYSARLGVSVWNGSHNVFLGDSISSSAYPLEKPGSSSGQFTWSFGRAFSGYWPIWTRFTQINPEGVEQWIWTYSYGP